MKTHLSFEDLQKGLEEFGVAVRRPPFLEDKGVISTRMVNRK